MRLLSGVIAETTEPVIFITGKRRDGLCVHTALHRPSTEPVIFITGKGPPRKYPVFKDLRGRLRAVGRPTTRQHILRRSHPVKSPRLSRLPPSSGPRISRITPPLASARLERGVVIDLATDIPREEPRLDLEHAAVTDPVVEERMRHQMIHPLLVRTQ